MSQLGIFLMGVSAGALVVVALLWRAVQYWDEGNGTNEEGTGI